MNFKTLFGISEEDPEKNPRKRNLVSNRQIAEIDHALLWSVLSLLAIGLIMVYSASIVIAGESAATKHQSLFYVIRHCIFLGIGFVGAVIAFQLKIDFWKKIAPLLFFVSVIVLALVLVPGIGKNVNGATRWISFGFFNIQPSELVKLFSVLYAASYVERKFDDMHKLQIFLPILALMGLLAALLLAEPDFGAFVVIISIFMGILFLGGFRAGAFFGAIALLMMVFAFLILSSPYRRARVFGFMDPWEDAFGKGYQLSHSLIAFGRGEISGVGLGGSVEKLFYLPEAHTDFLMAVLAEELGLIGVCVVIFLFALIVYRAFSIGWQCVLLGKVFESLVSMGIGIWLGIQAFFNMGVNMGLLPTKGLTLPLMSFGGSGIVVNCIGLAILLRIDWENRNLIRKSR